MDSTEVAEAMASYVAGVLDVAQAAEVVRPAYLAARDERAQQRQRDPPAKDEDASAPTAFAEFDVARWSSVITVQQYGPGPASLSARRA